MPDVFWRITPLMFHRMIRGYNRKQESEWRRTREIIAIIYNVNQTEKGKTKSGRELIPLDSDPPLPIVEPVQWSQEKIDKINSMLDRLVFKK